MFNLHMTHIYIYIICMFYLLHVHVCVSRSPSSQIPCGEVVQHFHSSLDHTCKVLTLCPTRVVKVILDIVVLLLLSGFIVSPVRMYLGGILWFNHGYAATSVSADTTS